jgi:hypothetical protein
MPTSADRYIQTAKADPDVRAICAGLILDFRSSGRDLAAVMGMRNKWSDDPDRGLPILLALSELAEDERETIAIAEQLEWFLMRHGHDYWDVVNQLCIHAAPFRAVVASVWGTSLSKDLRRKVEMWR